MRESKIGLDFGIKAPKIDRGFIQAIQSSGIPIIIGHDNILAHADPVYDVVFAFSLTMDFDALIKNKYRIYPTLEQIVGTADKMNLHDYCRREGIPTPITFPIPNILLTGMLDDSIVRKLQLLNRNIPGGALIKPRLAIGKAREITSHVYDPIGLKWNEILEHSKAAGVDFVLQGKINGPIRKVYGFEGHFYYETLGNDHRDPKPLPQSIARLCQTILRDFGLHWGAFDFIEDSDGVWWLFDINTTAVGRSIPPDKLFQFQYEMKAKIDSVMKGERPKELDQRLKIIIAAAGQNKRLKDTLESTPKSLVTLPDGTTVLDRVGNIARNFQSNSHMDPQFDILCSKENTHLFSQWRDKIKVPDSINLIHPDDEKIPVAHSSVNDIFSVLPNNQYVLMLSGDRIVEYPPGILEQCGEIVYHALNVEKAPYVVIGIPSRDETVYQYKTDSTGRILECKRGKIEDGINIHKIGFAFNTGKLPLVQSNNTQDIVVALSRRGCFGKLILLPEPLWSGDLDTPSDLIKFREHFQ